MCVQCCGLSGQPTLIDLCVCQSGVTTNRILRSFRADLLMISEGSLPLPAGWMNSDCLLNCQWKPINAWAAPNGFPTGCMQNNENKCRVAGENVWHVIRHTWWQIFELDIIFLLFLHRHITTTWCKPAAIPCKPLHCLSAQVSLIFLSPVWKKASNCLSVNSQTRRRVEPQSDHCASLMVMCRATTPHHRLIFFTAGPQISTWPTCKRGSENVPQKVVTLPDLVQQPSLKQRVVVSGKGSEMIHLFVWVKRIAHVLLIPLSVLMLP